MISQWEFSFQAPTREYLPFLGATCWCVPLFSPLCFTKLVECWLPSIAGNILSRPCATALDRNESYHFSTVRGWQECRGKLWERNRVIQTPGLLIKREWKPGAIQCSDFHTSSQSFTRHWMEQVTQKSRESVIFSTAWGFIHRQIKSKTLNVSNWTCLSTKDWAIEAAGGTPLRYNYHFIHIPLHNEGQL